MKRGLSNLRKSKAYAQHKRRVKAYVKRHPNRKKFYRGY